jgi:WD40 repeat protein
LGLEQPRKNLHTEIKGLQQKIEKRFPGLSSLTCQLFSRKKFLVLFAGFVIVEMIGYNMSIKKRETYSLPIQPLDILEQNRTGKLYQRDVKHHTGCVNALEFSNDENFLLSGGDDGGVALWRVGDLITATTPKPKRVMESRHHSNIFSLGFSLDGTAGYSCGNVS